MSEREAAGAPGAAREPRGAHRLVNPAGLAPGVGFSHAVLVAPGRTVYLGGQTAQRRDGGIAGATVTEQFDLALANLVTVLRAVGGEPEHLVNLTIYTTEAAAYRAGLRELGEIYRRHLGRHYPAMAFFEVKGLFDPAAMIELVGTAVIPD
ncbi:MAG TPA: RidA family protein [Streptosporangiaceae bacterium]